MGGVRVNDIQKPIIEVRDKVNLEPKEEDKADKLSFYIATPIFINGKSFGGWYKIGQKLPLWTTEQYKDEESYEVVQRVVDNEGKLILDEGGNAKVVTVRKTRSVLKTRKVQMVIDEAFKQELLSRSAQAKTQEQRIYKNEGITIEEDEHGNLITTRKM